MTALPRLRRHTDGRVALCLTGDLWSVTAPGQWKPWWAEGDEVSGDGWVELFVAALPEPDGHIVGDHWSLSTISCYVSTDGQAIDIDGIQFSLDQLRADALKMLAAVTACERYRAEREATR